MAKKKSLMDYHDDYIEYSRIQEEATFTGDYKASNKTYKKMQKILALAIESDEKEKFFLDILDRASDATTLTHCCADMMKLNIQPKLARERLEEMIRTKKIKGKECHPIFVSDAKLFLEEWDKGHIKPIV